MSVFVAILIAIGAIDLVAFGIAAIQLQNLLVDVPKEKLKEAGLSLENIVLNIAPNYLRKARQLKNPQIEQIAKRMQIEYVVFGVIFLCLLLYSIIIAL